jgi:hypothetical protein
MPKLADTLFLDFETAASADLTVCGSFLYSRCPDLAVTVVSWAIGDGPVKSVLLPGRDNLPAEIRAHIKAGKRISSWNIQFEIDILEGFFGVKVNPAQAMCTQQRAVYHGLPDTLGEAGPVLKIDVVKDTSARKLMLEMSRPKKDGSWAYNDPEKLKALQEYCEQDVRAERAISDVIDRLPLTENRVALLDRKANMRGVRFDINACKVMLDIAAKVSEGLTRECVEITNGAVDSPATNPGQIIKWINHPEVTSLAKANLDKLLKGDILNDVQKRVIEIRKLTAKSSISKLNAAIERADEQGVVRGSLQYYGAPRTGRWAGRGFQPQNIPRVTLKNPDAVLDDLIAGKDVSQHGPALDVITNCLRGVIIPRPGKKFVTFDLAQIEARVLPWLTGQMDLLKIFASGQDVYTHTANKLGSDNRTLGKVLVLACGYQMSWKKFKQTANETYGLTLTDQEAEDAHTSWREASPKIVRSWRDAEDAVRNAIKHPGKTYDIGGKGLRARTTLESDGLLLTLEMPSKRSLFYRSARVVGGQIKFMGVMKPSNHWGEMDTYGGNIIQNATQALARDVIANICLQIEAQKIGDIVFTVHDEVIVEVDEDKADEAYFKILDIMTTPPEWAVGLPLGADGHVQSRYGKGGYVPMREGGEEPARETNPASDPLPSTTSTCKAVGDQNPEEDGAVAVINTPFKPMPQDNEQFLKTLAEDVFDGLWVARYPKWDGGFAKDILHTFDEQEATYVAACTIEEGASSRSDATACEGWLFVLDDVGSTGKLDPATAALAPAPTYKIMTSEGNEQWGYRIYPVETDMARWNATYHLMRKTSWEPGCDNSGLAAYKRLPFGLASKPEKKGFHTHITEWNPDVRYSLDDLMSKLGVDFSEDNIATVSPPKTDKKAPIDRNADVDGDYVLSLFDEIGGKIFGRSPNRRGFIDIECPWADEHTGQDVLSRMAGYCAGGDGGFKCLHAHCEGKKVSDFIDYIDERATIDNRAHAAKRVFSAREMPEEEKRAFDRKADKIEEAKRRAAHFTFSPLDFDAMMAVEPRKFLYGKHYIRKFVSTSVAPGGVGKSSVSLVECVSMAIGRGLLDETVKRPLKVYYWNGEDPIDEVYRRIRAIIKHYDLTTEEIGRLRENLFVDSARVEGKKIKLAVQDKSSVVIAKPLVNSIVGELIDKDIDVMVVDPFVASHSVSENDNNAIADVAYTWSGIADATSCAVDLIHHVRKTNGAEITVEDGRGARALLDAARSARVFNPMSNEDAGNAGVSKPWLYFREDSGKSNLAPRAVAKWRKMEGCNIANGTEDEPGGDDVGVATVWEWTHSAEAITPEQMEQILAELEANEHGKSSQSNDWAGLVVADILCMDPDDKSDHGDRKKIISILKRLLEEGVLREERVAKPGRAKSETRLVLRPG